MRWIGRQWKAYKLFLMTGIAFAALAAVLVAYDANQGAGKTEQACAETQADPAATVPDGAAIKLDVDGHKLVHTVGRERHGYDEARQTLDAGLKARFAAGGETLTPEIVEGLSPVEGEGDGFIDGVKVTLGVDRTGRRLTVTSCVPTKDVSPGRYQGSVIVSGAELADPVVVPITATAKDSNFVLWTIIAVLAGFVGFALQTGIAARQLQEPPPKHGQRTAARDDGPTYGESLKAYMKHFSYWVAIIASLVGIAAAWKAIYYSGETWDAGGADLGKLLAGVFSGAVAGKTFGDLTGLSKSQKE